MLNPSGDSPEIVALALLERVARSEGRLFEHKPEEGAVADRKWILDTYFECLNAVRGHRMTSSARKEPDLSNL